jgi:hypothetical protein
MRWVEDVENVVIVVALAVAASADWAGWAVVRRLGLVVTASAPTADTGSHTW